jgi:hypothetical protein
VSVDLQCSPAGILFDCVAAVSKMKWVLAACAEFQTVQRISLNKTLRFPVPRKPRGPYLNRHSALGSGATATPGIHQEIAEPPRTTPIRQSETNKPDFIAATDGRRGVNFVQGLHGNRLDCTVAGALCRY